MATVTAPPISYRPEQSWRLLGRMLIEQGFLTDEALERALALQRHTQRRLGEILVEQGLVTPAVLAEAIAAQYGVARNEERLVGERQPVERSIVDRIEEQERLLEQMGSRLDVYRERLHAAEGLLSDREQRLAQLEGVLAEEESLIDQLARHEQAIHELQPRVEAQSARLREAEALLAERERRIAELEARLRELVAVPAPEALAPAEPDPTELPRQIAAAANLPFVDLRSFDLDYGVARFFPEELARRHLALPIRLQQGVVIVAMADPRDPAAVEAVARSVARSVRFVVVERGELLRAIARTYL